MTKNKNKLEFLKGGVISLFIKLMGMLCGYISTLYISNIYGASEFGKLSLAISVLGILSLLPKFGFDNALVRLITEFKFESDRKVKRILSSAFLIMLCLGVIVSILVYHNSGYISIELLKNKDFVKDLEFLSLTIIPFAFITLIYATFQAFNKTSLYLFFQGALLQLVILILIIIFSLTGNFKSIIPIYCYSIFIVLILGAIIFYTVFRTKFFKELKFHKIEFSEVKLILKKSFPMLLASSFILLLNWSDTIMLSIFSNDSKIGIYNVSQRLATIIGISLIAINAIAAPKFAEYYIKKDIKKLEETVRWSTKFTFFLSLPIFLGLIILPSIALSFFGSEFVDGKLALKILCIGQLINVLSGSTGYIMQMTDNEKTFQYTIMIAFIVNITLNWFLIPKYGINGAAIASVISMLFWNFRLIVFIKQKLGFWTFFRF